MRTSLDWDKLREVVHVTNHLNVHQRITSFNQYLPIVSPHLSWNWQHLKYIRHQIQKLENSEIRKLMIFCPPRHGKTEMTTLHFPAYLLERNPNSRVIVASYGQVLANKFSRQVRRIASERIILNKERKAVEEWETKEGGSLRAVGIGGGITGQGGDWIIIDDPVKGRKEACSITARDTVWDGYRGDFYTRLEPNAKVILIMTRWHEDDVAGRILASEDKDNWHVINLPALAKENDPLGRKEGEALCPERYTRDDLLRIKGAIGHELFEALYQGNPTLVEGNVLKVNRMLKYNFEDIPEGMYVVQAWDTAYKSGQENDYVAGQTWGYKDGDYYLLDRWHGKQEYSVFKQTVISKAVEYKPNLILIEDTTEGPPLASDLRAMTTFQVLPIPVQRDKLVRAIAITPVIDGGRVKLPQAADWLDEFLSEIRSFPRGKHDDEVDAMTMAVRFLMDKFAFQVIETDKLIKEVTNYISM